MRWSLAVVAILSGCTELSGPCPEVTELMVRNEVVDVAQVYNLEPNATLRLRGRGFQVLPKGMKSTQGFEITRVVLQGPEEVELEASWTNENELVMPIPRVDPPYAVGLYDMVITNPSGCRTVLEGAVEFLDQPPRNIDPDISVTSVLPGFGFTSQTTGITVRGSGFAPTPDVYISYTPSDEGLLDSVRLLDVSFLSPSAVSADVPPNLEVGGPYTIWVENPDGGVNFLDAAFTISDADPPRILTVDPLVGSTEEDTVVTMTGENFLDDPVVSLVNAEGVETLATVQSVDDGVFTVLFPTDSMGTGQYLVRAGFSGVFDDFAAFSVRNPEGRLGSSGNFQSAGAPLETARAGHGMLGLVDGRGRAFVYALGGESDEGPLDTIEVAPVDPFGEVGAWRTVPVPMRGPRAWAQWAIVDNWLYAIGGDNGSNPIITVERAPILVDDAEIKPRIRGHSVIEGGTLAAGAWFYRVGAIMGADDPYIPDGESISSPVESVDVTITEGATIKVEWNEVAGAVSYNVYRSDQANANLGREHLIASGITDLEIVDSGLPAGTESYVPEGGVGRWERIGELPERRRRGQAVVATTPEGEPIIYVVGGDNIATRTEVFAMIPPSGEWFVAGNLNQPRRDNGAAVASYDNAVNLGAGSPQYIVALHGNAGVDLSNVEFAEVQSGGMLSAFSDLNFQDGSTRARVGARSLVLSSHLYLLGGVEGYTDTVPNDGRMAPIVGPGLTVDEWRPTAGGAALSVPRYDFAATTVRTTVYLSGGRTRNDTLTKNVEQALY